MIHTMVFLENCQLVYSLTFLYIKLGLDLDTLVFSYCNQLFVFGIIIDKLIIFT